MDDQRPIRLGERIRAERGVGIAFAFGAGAAAAAVLQLVAPTWAIAGFALFPVLAIVREVLDHNRAVHRAWRSGRRGIARARGQVLRAPYSQRECLAYRARFTGAQFGVPGSLAEALLAGEIRERVADLTVEIGGDRVAIDGASARILCDVREGEGAPLRGDDADVFVPMTRDLTRRARHQELLLRDGDEVVVVGDGTLVVRGAPRAGEHARVVERPYKQSA